MPGVAENVSIDGMLLACEALPGFAQGDRIEVGVVIDPACGRYFRAQAAVCHVREGRMGIRFESLSVQQYSGLMWLVCGQDGAMTPGVIAC